MVFITIFWTKRWVIAIGFIRNAGRRIWTPVRIHSARAFHFMMVVAVYWAEVWTTVWTFRKNAMIRHWTLCILVIPPGTEHFIFVAHYGTVSLAVWILWYTFSW